MKSRSINRYYLSFLPIILSALIFWGYFLKNQKINTYNFICQLVADKIYLDSNLIFSWRNQCLNRGYLLGHKLSTDQQIEDLQSLFSYLQTSHLNIYDETSVKQIWKGESLETGIESQFVDGDLVILNVHYQSPGFKMGLRKGDVIIQINGEHPNPSLAQYGKGNYRIQRSDHQFDVNLIPGRVTLDQSPQLISLGKERAHLKIPSFRGEFFSDQKWKSMVQGLKRYQEIIIDLRGNLGGNIVAGLRFLSPFICSPTEVGLLKRPRFSYRLETRLSNEIDDEKQIQTLEKSSVVHLSTYPGYECLQSKLAVLVDSRTASAAELVAAALKEKKEAVVLGERTSGQLLIGIWYPLNFLKKGVKISIPEALYISSGGLVIESNGVAPDRQLYYKKSDLQKGKDNWIFDSLTH